MNISIISDTPIGVSATEYAAIIAAELADENKQSKYVKHLPQVGYQSAKPKV